MVLWLAQILGLVVWLSFELRGKFPGPDIFRAASGFWHKEREANEAACAESVK